MYVQISARRVRRNASNTKWIIVSGVRKHAGHVRMLVARWRDPRLHDLLPGAMKRVRILRREEVDSEAKHLARPLMYEGRVRGSESRICGLEAGKRLARNCFQNGVFIVMN
jgi:hypothetical protein